MALSPRLSSVQALLTYALYSKLQFVHACKLGKRPQFGMYEASWISGSLGAGPLLLIGGVLGLVGLQKKNATYMNVCRGLKLAQMALAVSGALIVLLNMDEVSNQVVDDWIADMVDEAKRNHEDPPVLDRNMLLSVVVSMLRSQNLTSIAFWVLLGGYSLLLIHSVFHWLSESVDLDKADVVVMLPPRSMDQVQSVRVQYATPLLQGQSPSIPVSIS